MEQWVLTVLSPDFDTNGSRFFFSCVQGGEAPHDDSNISPEFSYYFMGKIAALMPGVAGKTPTSP